MFTGVVSSQTTVSEATPVLFWGSRSPPPIGSTAQPNKRVQGHRRQAGFATGQETSSAGGSKGLELSCFFKRRYYLSLLRGIGCRLRPLQGCFLLAHMLMVQNPEENQGFPGKKNIETRVFEMVVPDSGTLKSNGMGFGNPRVLCNMWSLDELRCGCSCKRLPTRDQTLKIV